jgi:hypothetical protein
VRGNFLPRHGVQGWKYGHFHGLLACERLVEKLQGRGQSFRARARGDQDHDGPAKFRSHVRRDQSLGGIGEPGHTLMRDSLRVSLRNPAPQRRNRGFESGMAAYRSQRFRNRR